MLCLQSKQLHKYSYLLFGTETCAVVTIISKATENYIREEKEIRNFFVSKVAELSNRGQIFLITKKKYGNYACDGYRHLMDYRFHKELVSLIYSFGTCFLCSVSVSTCYIYSRYLVERFRLDL